MIRVSSSLQAQSQPPRDGADAAHITPQSAAFAAEMSLVSLQKKNAKQQHVDAQRALELLHIKAQNACNTSSLRNEVQLAWNNYGAALISEAQMLAIFAECSRAAAAAPRQSSAEVGWGEHKRAPIWPTYKG